MSRYNAAHARLFTGVVPAIAHDRKPAHKAYAVTLVRQLEQRARFRLEAGAVKVLALVVGDRVLCSLEYTDGGIAFAVDVYAVHDGGFVDVRGYETFDAGDPRRITLERFAMIGAKA